MHFHIVTLFPKSFGSYLGESILKRAIEGRKLKFLFIILVTLLKTNGRELTARRTQVVPVWSSKLSP